MQVYSEALEFVSCEGVSEVQCALARPFVIEVRLLRLLLCAGCALEDCDFCDVLLI